MGSNTSNTDNSRLTIVAVVFITSILVGLMLYQHNWDIHQPSPILENTESLPDFGSYSSVAEKKVAFFDYLRPFIRQENQKIRYDRAFLKSISDDIDRNSYHNNANIRKLRRLALRYDVPISDIPYALEELMVRIDVIPESLVLAQAANESAWGTSRFARQANNLFGQWCFKKGCGLVPTRRDSNASHEVRVFQTPQQSVVSYMRNLNSHIAYDEFRQIRTSLRSRQAAITGVKLAAGLANYSERREDYVKEIIHMINQNNLE